MSKLRHAMIDLETMGTSTEAAIVSVGIVIFDPRIGKIDRKNTYYAELDWKRQGRVEEQSCMDNFWSKQPAKIRDALKGTDKLEDVLEDIAMFLPADCKVWGNGPTFDITKLEHCYDQCGIEVPWKFWNIRDCRTVKDMFESSRGGLDKKVGGGGHNALQDALHQAQYICAMWYELVNK